MNDHYARNMAAWSSGKKHSKLLLQNGQNPCFIWQNAKFFTSMQASRTSFAPSLCLPSLAAWIFDETDVPNKTGIQRGEKISPLPQAVYGCARRRAEDDAARSWQGFRLSEGQIRAILSAPLLLFWSINRWRPPLVPFSPAAAGGLTS